MADQWELVGKKKNKGDGSKKINKQQKKKFVENMPKLEEAAPIKESQTMFDLFLEQECKKAQQQAALSKINGAASNKTKKESVAQPQKKKNAEKKKGQATPKALTLEEAIAAINLDEMEAHFARVCGQFPDSPLVWAQDLVTYLNLKIDVEIEDPIFSTKPIGYPASLLGHKVSQQLYQTLQCCSKPHLYEFCFVSMIQDTAKGLNTVGYRIFLQLLSQDYPDLAVDFIPKCIEYRNSYQNRPKICLAIMWAIGQSGNKCLEAGLRVWLDIMFPILGTRAYSEYVTGHIDLLLNSHSSLKLSKSVVSVRDLFPVLDYVFSSAGLNAKYQKQLQALYPKLKFLSYEPDPSSVLRNYFPSYLRRLEPTCTTAMRKELLMSLVECLAIDKHSYSVWRQLYIKHLSHSSFLIRHLSEEWHNLPKTFPRKLLLETLSTFQVTNEDLRGQGKTNQDVEEAVAACNALMSKMNAHTFPWSKILLFLTIAVTALFAYDVQQHGSFKKSKTAELMKEAGMLAICEQAYGKISIYSGKAYTWLEVNVPVYTSWAQETFGPYLNLFFEKLFTFLVYLWDSTLGIRTWANETIPPLLQTVSDNFPKYRSIVSSYARDISQYLVSVMSTVWQFLGHYTSIVVQWLHQNVFTGSLSAENLQKYAGDTVQAFQEYTVTTYNWISKHVATIIYPGK